MPDHDRLELAFRRADSRKQIIEGGPVDTGDVYDDIGRQLLQKVAVRAADDVAVVVSVNSENTYTAPNPLVQGLKMESGFISLATRLVNR